MVRASYGGWRVRRCHAGVQDQRFHSPRGRHQRRNCELRHKPQGPEQDRSPPLHYEKPGRNVPENGPGDHSDACARVRMFLHIAESQENPTGMGKPVVAPTVCNASSAANAQRLRRLASVLGEMAAGGNHRRATTRSNRMVVRSGGRVLFVKASEVDWVEAASDYVTLHVGKKSLLLRETITEMERKLGSTASRVSIGRRSSKEEEA